MFCRRFIKCNDSSEFCFLSWSSQIKAQLQRPELVISCQASIGNNLVRFFFQTPLKPCSWEVWNQSYLLPHQSENPLNSSLKQVSLCCPGARCTPATMSCSSLISRQQKQHQQMVSGQEKGETQKPHRQWPVKNFSSWKVNNLLLLWTFPYRLQCMSLVHQDTVRDISWNQLWYKSKNPLLKYLALNLNIEYLEATTEQSSAVRESSSYFL